MEQIAVLNAHVLSEVDAYLAIPIRNISFPAPYAINEFGMALTKLLGDAGVSEEQTNDIHDRYENRETAFGWHLGKAAASELIQSLPKLLDRLEIPTHIIREYSVLEIMKLYGLGVDCSGFVYNVLRNAFSAEGMEDEFINSLDWRSDKHDVTHAGTFVFAGKASYGIGPQDVRPLDLMLIRAGEEYVHIGLIVEREGGLRLAQSALLTEPSGVTDTAFSVDHDKPRFSIMQGLGSDWNRLYDSGALEFRRLRFIDV